MGEEDIKAKLVREICTVSSAFARCDHRCRSTPRVVAFVDWYLILDIDEDAGVDVIRRRYRQLALKLHPDKNRHPKAEVAFKLVSEAYECLTNKDRRRAFDSERRSNFCKECHRKLRTGSPKSQCETGEQSGCSHAEQAKSYRKQHAMREARNRLREECRVIEGCLLRATEASRCRHESPVFDPSDCLLFSGYPHHRGRSFENQKDCWSIFQASLARKVRCESPVYEIRQESRQSRTRTTHFKI